MPDNTTLPQPSNWGRFRNSVLIVIAILIFFPVSSLLSLEQQPVIIDIRGAIYVRLDVFLKPEKNITRKAPLLKYFIQALGTNLRWSGLFNVHKQEDLADVNIELQKIANNIVQANVLTQSGVNLFSKKIHLSDDPQENEEKLIEFINELSIRLTGEKSILGTAIVYAEQTSTSEKNLILVNTHGKKRNVIIQDGSYNLLPRWTPDGEGIVYTTTGVNGTRIMEFDFETQKKRVISHRKGISSGGSWGPDKNELIITISMKGNPDLYRINRDGQIIKRITNRSSIDTAPSWSPDGKAVLFVSNRSGTVQVYQMLIESGDIFRMSFEGNYNTDPRWSKDGAYIVYAGMVNRVFQVFLMDRDGEHSRQLTQSIASSEQPEWSPDGRQLVFTSEVNGDQKIFIMTTDGAYKRRLTRSGKGVKETNPAWSRNFKWERSLSLQ